MTQGTCTSKYRNSRTYEKPLTGTKLSGPHYRLVFFFFVRKPKQSNIIVIVYFVFLGSGHVVAVRVAQARDYDGALFTAGAEDVAHCFSQTSARHGSKLARHARDDKRSDCGHLGGHDFRGPRQWIVELKKKKKKPDKIRQGGKAKRN